MQQLTDYHNSFKLIFCQQAHPLKDLTLQLHSYSSYENDDACGEWVLFLIARNNAELLPNMLMN